MDLVLSQKITLLLIVPQSKLKPLPDKDKQKSVRALGLHFFLVSLLFLLFKLQSLSNTYHCKNYLSFTIMLNSSIYRKTFDSLVWTSGSNIDQPSFDKQKWKVHLNNPSCPYRRKNNSGVTNI